MYLKLYLIALPVFFAIDMVWLGLIAKNFYSSQIGFLMKDAINWPAAIIFYLLFILGLVFFVVEPAIQEESITKLIISAVLFGLITYATYDLTNLATIKGWPLTLVGVDLLWGVILSTSVSLITYYLATKFLI